MARDYKAHQQELNENALHLAQAAPETMAAMRHGREVVFKDGALSHQTKELIAAAIGIAMRCDGCVTHHVHLAQKLGVSREALVEMIGVCIQLGGGPAMANGGEALAAYDQFTESD